MKKKKLEVFDGVLKYLNASAAIGTMLATIALIWSNCQTREQIEQAKEQVIIQRESVELQRRSIDNLDSNFILLREQVNIQREATETQKDLVKVTQKETEEGFIKYINEYKPNVYVSKAVCLNDSNSLKVYLDFHNGGKSKASNVVVKYTVIDNKGLNIIDKTTSKLGNIAANFGINDNFISKTKNEFVFKIEIKWKWEGLGIIDSSESFRNVVYEKDAWHCYLANDYLK
jgi:hypothetical protein